MTNRKYLYIYLFGVFACLIETISTENKTSSECWACNPNTPHVLSCTGSSVIVIHGASYGYKPDCSGGITGAGCTEVERNRCCKPGGPSLTCLESFNETDRGVLERTCSSKSTCTFNSTRHDQPYTCSGFTFTNTFTLINYTCQIPESKTSSECWGCNPNTPHVLSCTGSSVIVIHSASFGYKGSCSGGITPGGGCNGAERNRCCKPGGPTINCFKSFNVTDREELETACSSKSTCTFNSIRHDQPFTLINYTCQTPVSNTVPITSSTKTPIDTTTQYDTTSTRFPASKAVTLPSDGGKEMSSSAGEGLPSYGGKEMASSDGKITSGEIGGIVVGVIAVVILLGIAAFLLYQRYENTNRQPEPNRQQSTTRTVGVQYRETDFTDITTSPNITTSSSDTSYSQLNRLGSQPVQYDGLIMNNNNRNSTTDNNYNYNNYYNQQYVNM